MVSTTLLIDFRDIKFDSLDGNSHFCPCTHSLILAAGAGTPIANEAVAIWEAVKEQVNANQTEIKKLEEDVNEQLNGKPKKKKKKKKKGAEGLVGNIDLGDIDFEGLGSDSDDDGLMNL